MSIITGLATAILTTKAISFFNRLFTNGKVMFDISLLEYQGNSMQLGFIVTNYSGSLCEIQLKKVQLYKKGINGSVVKLMSKDLVFDGMRLLDGESHVFTNVFIDISTQTFLSDPLVELIAIVNKQEVRLKPFQYYKNLAVYDQERAAAYKSIQK